MNALNGKPVVRFNGISGCMLLPNGFSDFGQGVSAFIVATVVTNVGGWGRFLELGSAGNCDNLVILGLWDTVTDFDYNTVNGHNCTSPSTAVRGTSAVVFNQAALYEIVQQPSGAVAAYKNGSSIAAGTIPLPGNVTRSINGLGCSLVGNGTTPGHFLYGDLAEVILYGRALNNSDQQAIERYLVAKWGL